MRFQTDAIVIRRAPFSETSQVVDLLTADEGRITALARGSFRPKSTFGGPVDLLTRGVADVTRRRTSELDLLHGLRVTEPYRGLRRDLRRWLAACHALELVRAFAWPRDRERVLFRYLAGALDLVSTARDDDALDTWLTSLAGRVLDAAGLAPRLDACVACGGAIEPGGACALSLAQGGALCARCAPPDRSVVRGSPGVLALLRRALEGAGTLTGSALSASVVTEARRAVDLYLEYRMERPLHARRLLDRPFDAGGHGPLVAAAARGPRGGRR